MTQATSYSTFTGDRLLVSGDLATTLTALKNQFDADPNEQHVTIIDETGRPTDFDLRGSLDEVLRRYDAGDRKAGPGRPRLGVVSREVSLLPRHWAWLADQPAGASGTLRRLVDEAAKRESAGSRARRASAVTGRVMTILAGDRENFEEAYRALERRDAPRFAALTASWPVDVRSHLSRLAQPAFAPDDDVRGADEGSRAENAAS